MRARVRFLLYGAVFLAGALAVGWIVLDRLLSSERLAPLVAARLRDWLGRPVQVDRVNLGLRTSSVEDLRVFEAETSASSNPCLLVRQVQADVSLVGVLFGKAQPHDLTLDGAFCTLRFDQAGRLQTHLPRLAPATASLPSVWLRQGQLVLRQEERPDFVLTGVSGQVSEAGSQLLARGSVQDPSWGLWTFHGSWDRASERGRLVLQASAMHVTQAMLERLPLVPAKVWKQVQCEGDTPVDIELGFQAGAPRPHYRITLSPQETHVHISSIQLSAEHARGQVVIEDGVVTLKEVQGQAADGLLKTEADLIFNTRPAQLRFDIWAEQLDLRRLPQKWAFPRLGVQGRLDGQAHLLITVREGRALTSGDGTGMVNQARIAGLPLKRPIPVRLYSDGERLHFSL
jgi:hypothetical protein